MLTCDSQNRIMFKDVIAQINKNINAIGAAIGGVNRNTTSIADHDVILQGHEQRLSLIEGSGGTLPVIEARLTLVENNLGELTTDVTANENKILIHEGKLSAINGELATLSTSVTDNTDAIALLVPTMDEKVDKKYVLSTADDSNKILTEDDFLNQLIPYCSATPDNMAERLITRSTLDTLLGIKNYSVVKHIEASGTGGGNATAGSWQIRTIGTAFDDNLGILVAGNKLNIPAGDYLVSGFAVAQGTYHQCRLFDTTSGTELCLGSSGDGTSFLDSSFTLAADGMVEVQSQVEIDVLDGYGTPNPFGEGVFIELKITRIGG